MSDDFTLRIAPGTGNETPTEPAAGLAAGERQAINEQAELLADLLAATGLLAPDKLALARGRAGAAGSLAQALVDEGAASADGIARTLAARYQLPLIDLGMITVDPEASKLVPLHVLERSAAIPYEIDGDILRVAVSDPGNVHAIDELRLATRLTVELAVASRDDVDAEVRRLVRQSEAFGARAALDEEAEAFAAEEEDATTSKSTTASPMLRSSGSSTPSSSRPPKTAPRTSTGSRRRTRSSSASASTACCRRCSGFPSGSPPA